MTKRLLIGTWALVLGLTPVLAQLEPWSGQRSSTTHSRPARPNVGPTDGGGFGERIAGTYLGELFLEEADGPFFEFVMTLHADGTLEASDAGDFLLGFESPSIGVWRRNASHQLTFRLLYFRYDSFGNLFLMGRDTAVAEFADDLRTASGKYTGEALLPNEILLSLDPDAGVPLLSDTSNFRMTRLEPDIPWGPVDGDDEPKSAIPIACPSFVSAKAAIETFDDRDFYLLSGPPGQTIAIDIDAQLLGSNLDTILGAFDTGLSLLAGSDDNPAPGEPGTFDSYLTVEMPEDGSLFLVVAPYRVPFDFEGSGYSIGAYTLSVECGAEAAARSTIDRPDLVYLDQATPGRLKPHGEFAETLRPGTTSDDSGANRKWAGTYLVGETGFFGEVRDLVTFHTDGTFSFHFEGGMALGMAAVRGACRVNGTQQLACEGLDMLHGFFGLIFLFDRISWMIDFDDVPGLASGVQVTQELYDVPTLLNPPQPNFAVDVEELFAFGLGADLPVMRRLEVPVESVETPGLTVDAEFANRVAGSYLGMMGGIDYFLAKLNADGTFVATDTSHYRFSKLDSPLQGVWVRSGPLQITVRALGFETDPALARRMTLVVDFDEDFTVGSGVATEETFLREQILDPVDPNTDENPLREARRLFRMRPMLIPGTNLDDGTGGDATAIDRLEDESFRPGNRDLRR